MALPFEVTILGVNSAMPVFGRHPSSQVLRYNGKYMMIDCGEGTQNQLSKFKIKRTKISDILISHLHGDHVFGLPGLLTSMSLLGRESALVVHGPVGIKKMLETILEISGSFISYQLDILEYNTEVNNTISLHPNLEISTIPLKHRIPTMGYMIKEINPALNIASHAIENYRLTVDEMKEIKKGKTIHRNGVAVPLEDLVVNINQARAYAYVSDTIYNPAIVPYLKGVTTLYHETTYLDDLEELAKERFHTTISGAVDIARKAGAKKLITGHYSSRYHDANVFLEAGQKLWNGVVLGEEGMTYTV